MTKDEIEIEINRLYNLKKQILLEEERGDFLRAGDQEIQAAKAAFLKLNIHDPRNSLLTDFYYHYLGPNPDIAFKFFLIKENVPNYILGFISNQDDLFQYSLKEGLLAEQDGFFFWTPFPWTQDE